MNNLEGLRAGAAEMRSVAQKLNQWADDLEASFRGTVVPESVPETDVSEVPASEPVPAPPLTLPGVRAVLAEKCAAGFSTQVKALIESYGVSSLKEVPAEKYGELLSAVAGLGSGGECGSGSGSSVSGGDADAG